jgi:putative ABC transport system permease protein
MLQMMRSAARSVFAGRGRFVLTGTAIMVSVAFLVATLVLSDSMRGRAASDIAEALTGTDAVVQGVVLGEPGGGPADLGRSVRRTLMHFLTATSEHIQT